MICPKIHHYKMDELSLQVKIDSNENRIRICDSLRDFEMFINFYKIKLHYSRIQEHLKSLLNKNIIQKSYIYEQNR